MTLVLGIDPGVESPGYAVWCTEQQRHVYVGAALPPGDGASAVHVSAIIVESGFIGRIGKLGMWGLGFGAGWRLHEASRLWPNAELFKTRPDGVQGWRAALIERPGCFRRYDGLSKAVVVSRLRDRYNVMSRDSRRTKDWTDDMVEACGIAEAAAAILARPKASQRKALKPVRF